MKTYIEDVNRRFDDEETILHLAARDGDLEALKLALDYGGDVKKLTTVSFLRCI